MKKLLLLMLVSTTLVSTYFLSKTPHHQYLLLQTLLWAALAVILLSYAHTEYLTLWKKYVITTTPTLYQTTLLITLFHLAMYYLTGLIVGFVQNPLVYTPESVLITLAFLLSFLGATELARSMLLHQRTILTTRTLGLITLLLATLTIYTLYFSPHLVTTTQSFLQFSIATIIPTIAMGLFASYLCYHGGAYYSLSYLAPLTIAMLFSPLLPNIPWMSIALLNTGIALFGFMLVQQSLSPLHFPVKKKRFRQTFVSWSVLFLLSTTTISFATGLIGVQPVVVIGGSMQPTLEVGDVVIVASVPLKTIQEQDIIHFQAPHRSVTHRVVNITTLTDGAWVYRTKGDANEVQDVFPVYSPNVRGKVMYTIPKVGWISIYVQQAIQGASDVI